MLISLRGGHVVDPVNGVDAVGDLFIEDGRIVAPPPDARRTSSMTSPAMSSWPEPSTSIRISPAAA